MMISYKKVIRTILAVVTSPYMLKNKEKCAFGIPFNIHRLFHGGELKKWDEYKNIHRGNRCFIIGTGPSLKIDDLNKLGGEYTFSVNSIINFYEKTDWRPSYYCIVDPRVYEALEDQLVKYQEIISFYPTNRIKTNILSGPAFPLDCSDMYKAKTDGVLRLTKFGTNPKKAFYDGATVVYATMQIAAYMGFKEIYLLGVDCNYGYTKNFHNRELEYNSDKYKYRDTKDTGKVMIEAFKIAKKYADENGIKIYNTSEGGMLDVFERISLEKVLDK